MKSGDMALGVIVILVILLFLIPLPPFLLDFLLTINIGLALIILLNALFSKESLDMYLFPTILLLTTLFRLGLTLASTRLILGEGEAGQVIATFGSFVAGGNIVVGAILFIIIVIIQFLVVTKGAERVAEVSARFTLDAMPGKQMAIDADLNSGVIDDKQAKERRDKIQEEASFFGSMDGASKFVKNDAIVSIIVIFVNIIGGLILGMTGVTGGRPLTFGDAIDKYTILTIGDGLVAQLPALLISVATGILVTKAAKETDMSAALIKQLFSIPKVLYLTGGVLVFLGVFTPLPWYSMVPSGVLCILGASAMDKNLKRRSIETEISTEDVEVEEIRKPENVISLLQVDPIELEFGYGIIPLADANQGGDLLDRVVMIRRQIALELGTIVPIIRLRDNIQLNPNQYIIKIKGIEVVKGDIMFDHYMAMNPGYVEEEIDGIDTIEPAFGQPALWITEKQREKAESFGYAVVDPPSIIATHLTEIIKSHLHELLTRQDVQTLITKVKETNDVLVDELTPKLMNIGEIQKVLGNLLREGISIRDLVSIFETLADYAHNIKDTDVLTEYVRQSLRRAISKKCFEQNQTNNVLTLDPELEQQIMDSIQQSDHGAYIAMNPRISNQIIEKINIEVSKSNFTSEQPIILTSPIVRLYFKKIIEEELPNIIVLSFNEVDTSTVEIQPVGMVSINEN
ncbi:MAG TPA: flagellar biosynthesis protein FlhA [Clostridiales bacterium]|nr:MAG: flagellar biosynthesis protein FlhA [Clostridiales bacterium GWD2_32_59]HAN10592.1 flagellar biosynthesis protein FlhA [Clostridiales bacterium]